MEIILPGILKGVDLEISRPFLSFGVSTFGREKVTIDHDRICLCKTELIISEIESIVFFKTSEHHTFWNELELLFRLESKKRKILLKCHSLIFLGNKNINLLHQELLNAFNMFIRDVMITKMVTRIFDKNESVIIGNCVFSKTGCDSEVTGYGCISWGNIGVPPVSLQPAVTNNFMYRIGMTAESCLRLHDLEGKVIGFVSMTDKNALLFPELVEACRIRFEQMNQL